MFGNSYFGRPFYGDAYFGHDEGGGGGGGDDTPSDDWNVRRLQVQRQRPVRISTRVRPVRFPNPRR